MKNEQLDEKWYVIDCENGGICAEPTRALAAYLADPGDYVVCVKKDKTRTEARKLLRESSKQLNACRRSAIAHMATCDFGSTRSALLAALRCKAAIFEANMLLELHGHEFNRPVDTNEMMDQVGRIEQNMLSRVHLLWHLAPIRQPELSETDLFALLNARGFACPLAGRQVCWHPSSWAHEEAEEDTTENYGDESVEAGLAELAAFFAPFEGVMEAATKRLKEKGVL